MNVFLKKISIYFIAILVLYVGIFNLVKIINISKYIYPVANSKNDIVMFADSVGWQINTENLGISNLSFGSESYTDIENKIKFLIREKKVSTAIITYDDHMISDYRGYINNNHRSVWLNPMPFSKKISNLISYRNEYLYVFQFGIIRRTKDFINDNIYGNNEGKIEENFNDFSDKEKFNMVKKKIEQQYSKYSNSEIQTFNRILKLCKKNNIKIILIKFPLNKIFIEERNKNKLFNENRRHSHPDFRLFDFSESLQDLNFYRDQNHLNEFGKIEFLKLLKNELNKI